MKNQTVGTVIAVLSLCAATQAETEESPWTLGRMFERSGAFLVPLTEVRLGPDAYGREWDFTQADRGNFTFFDAVENVRATEQGALAFTLTEKTATLGWGNYGGRQPKEARVLFWPRFYLKLKARQSVDQPTTFAVRFWAKGKRDGKDRKTFDPDRHVEVLKGTDWQELSYRIYLLLPRRDGFDVEVKGASGNRVEIKDLQITRYENQGCFRKEIVLPDSRVWRAVAEVGAMTHLYINGREVPSPTGKRPHGLYGNESVDLSEYFEPGKANCLALFGHREGETEGQLPYICMQGSVIMSSGERICIDTDTAWQWTPQAPEGWRRPGFDDSRWRPVTTDSKAKDSARVQPNWCLHYKGKLALPVHDGYLRLANPGDSQLYYRDDQEVAFHAYVPNGLDKLRPRLEWTISRYEHGRFVELSRGTADFDRYLGRSIRCTVNIGPLARGVYTLKAMLRAGDQILDDRVPEPLVVTGRLPMTWTDGDTYTQGMDLALEREIDLTDPQDGPWTEAAGGRRAPRPTNDPDAGIKEPTIVERRGLKYRETKPNYGAMISYLVELKHPGDFYLMELDYPNDVERHLGVACCPANWGLSSHRTYSKTSASVCTGGRYPITGEMQTLRWLYRPDPGRHSLNLVATRGGAPAAGARLRMYHIKNGLPALRASSTHTRWNGLITERTRANPDRFGIVGEPAPEGPREYSRFRMGSPDSRPVLEICRRLEHHLDACEAFVRYLRFTGQNVHVMGTFQYSPHNAPGYIPDWPFPCARVRGGIRDVFARVMRDNHIDFYAHVEFVYTPRLMQMAARQPTRPDAGFWDTLYLVKSNGEEYTEWGGRYGFNFNHPDVRGEMLSTAANVARKFASLPNFKGIVWTPYFGGDWIPTYRGRLQRGPQTPQQMTALGYGDVSIREFEKDTGRKLPFSLDDPGRFLKRHEYLNSQAMRRKWLAWRAERMKAFFHGVADAMHHVRRDLKCVCDLYLNPVHDTEWRSTGWSFREYLLANGWDGELFAEDDSICLAHVMYGVMNKRSGSGGDRPGWDMSGLPARYDFFKADRNRAVQIKHDWVEVEEMAWHLPYRENWPRHFQLTMMEQPDGANTREVFIRSLIGADPDLFFYGFADATLFEGNEQPLRELNRVLRALPSEKFAPVADTGLGSNLAIRELREDEAYWFYVANPGYWPVTGEITLQNAPAVHDAVKGEPAGRSAGDRTRVDLALRPFGLAAFRTPSGQAKIVDWQAHVTKGKGTEHLESIVKETEALLALPAALVVLRPEDEAFMREAVASAKKDLAQRRYASALLTTSSDRFWMLKTAYMEKGAQYATEAERDAQASTGKKEAASRLCDAAPTIDGRPGDGAWRSAESYGGFVASDGMPAMAQTSFQVAHDSQGNLYFFFRCKDRKPAAIKMDARGEQTVFKDDCVALFLQPDPAQSAYYQMAFTAGGVKFDQQVKGGARNYEFAPPWEVKTAVTDAGWVAEVKLPASSLEGRIEPGQPWAFNAHRAVRNRMLPPSSWSYSPVSWHDVERFGVLDFQ